MGDKNKKLKDVNEVSELRGGNEMSQWAPASSQTERDWLLAFSRSLRFHLLDSSALLTTRGRHCLYLGGDPVLCNCVQQFSIVVTLRNQIKNMKEINFIIVFF